VQACGECGESNPERARFCLACGRSLGATREEARKVVTVLFADVVGSTAAGERHDPEAYQRVLNAHFDLMQALTERHGGTVEKFIGDAMMAVFGLPRIHEDDALRAVRAAAQIRAEIARLTDVRPGRLKLAWRFGVNTGDVLVGGSSGRTLATGDAVNMAARLEQAAAPGEILIGASTYALVRDAVDAEPVHGLVLKGKSAQVSAFRILSVHQHVDGRLRRFDLPFVGRHDERAQLGWVLDRVTRSSSPQLVTVLGDAGIGKTRLVASAVEDLGVRVLRGRCRAYGQGVPWWPLAEALADAAGIDVGTDDAATVQRKLGQLPASAPPDDLLATVAVAVGLSDAGFERDATTALREYLGDIAGDAGVVLVLDDLHHAQDELLDALEVLVRSRDLRLALIALARPDLLERRRTWSGGALNAHTLLLEPLADDEIATLAQHRLTGPLHPATRDELVTSAGGNPLFVEELIAMLLEDGTLQLVDGTWQRSGRQDQTIPASIQALLGARVDALDRPDRTVLGRAAVVGLTVPYDALHSLTDEAERLALDESLHALVDRDLLRPARAAYAFRHPFVREAVYQALPRRTRADLHERHARWLMARAGGPQIDQLAADHLERALEERGLLDPDDPALGILRATTGDWLIAAGSRALHRGDMAAAARLNGAAVDLLDEDDVRRASALADRGRALSELGDFEAGAVEVERACAAALRTGDEALVAHMRLTAVNVRSNLALDGWVEEASMVADESIEVFSRRGDARGLARAWGMRAETHFLTAQFTACEAAVEQASVLADEANDDAERRRNVFRHVTLLPVGRRPVTEGLATCRQALEQYAGDRTVEARVLQVQALLLAMDGAADAARAALSEATQRFQELNQAYWLAFGDLVAGRIKLLTDDASAAETAFRRAITALTEMGDRSYAALAAAELVARTPGDRLDDADVLFDRALADAAADDLEAQVWVRLASARLDARRGDHDAAVAAAQQAATLAATSDGPVLQADALLGVAEHAAAAWRASDPPSARSDHHRSALDAARAAAERYAAKEHLVGRDRAMRLLEGLDA
jgi:class 3 adenylate cyclase/tetratricopeptide (TPR) repeat protein